MTNPPTTTPTTTPTPAPTPAPMTETATVPLDRLEHYPGNARRGHLDAIKDSLAHHGQYRPIVANQRNRQVLAGNHTLAAARALGWEELEVTWVDVDDDQAARIVLVDNRTNDLATYDDELLAALLEPLTGYAGTGWNAEDVAELLDSLAGEPEQLTDPDEVPPTPDAPVSEEGDVWILGRHRLAVGDGTDPAVVAAALGGATADAYITDPPYNVNYTGGTADALQIDNDDMEDAAFRAFLTELFTAALEHTKRGGPIYVFHADTEGVNFRHAFVDAGWDLKQVLVWVKNSLVLGRQDHQWQHEPILYGWRPGAAHAWYGGRALTTIVADDQPAWGEMKKPELVALLRQLHEESTVLRFDKPSRNAEHPTMKPVALLASLLDRSTRPGDVALDTCAGSGSLVIAAHGTNRTAALVEMDERYADVICRRYQAHTGQVPVLEATGEAHDFTPRGA